MVFEFLDYDLKKYMDRHAPTGIPTARAKVQHYFVCQLNDIWCVGLFVSVAGRCGILSCSSCITQRLKATESVD